MGLSLKYKLDDRVEIDGETYEVDAMFDVLLRVIDLTQDEDLNPNTRVSTALVFLIGTEKQTDRHLDIHDDYIFLEKYAIDERLKILESILNKYVDIEQKEPVDRLGNPMPVVEQEEKMKLLDFDYDADSIYASFMQAYGMDLIEQQGKLHWHKFVALLNGLPEESPLKKIISVRSWNPQDEKKKYESRMREAQKKLAIPHER